MRRLTAEFTALLVGPEDVLVLLWEDAGRDEAADLARCLPETLRGRVVIVVDRVTAHLASGATP